MAKNKLEMKYEIKKQKEEQASKPHDFSQLRMNKEQLSTMDNILDTIKSTKKYETYSNIAAKVKEEITLALNTPEGPEKAEITARANATGDTFNQMQDRLIADIHRQMKQENIDFLINRKGADNHNEAFEEALLNSLEKKGKFSEVYNEEYNTLTGEGKKMAEKSVEELNVINRQSIFTIRDLDSNVDTSVIGQYGTDMMTDAERKIHDSKILPKIEEDLKNASTETLLIYAGNPTALPSSIFQAKLIQKEIDRRVKEAANGNKDVMNSPHFETLLYLQKERVSKKFHEDHQSIYDNNMYIKANKGKIKPEEIEVHSYSARVVLDEEQKKALDNYRNYYHQERKKEMTEENKNEMEENTDKKEPVTEEKTTVRAGSLIEKDKFWNSDFAPKDIGPDTELNEDQVSFLKAQYEAFKEASQAGQDENEGEGKEGDENQPEGNGEGKEDEGAEKGNEEENPGKIVITQGENEEENNNDKSWEDKYDEYLRQAGEENNNPWTRQHSTPEEPVTGVKGNYEDGTKYHFTSESRLSIETPEGKDPEPSNFAGAIKVALETNQDIALGGQMDEKFRNALIQACAEGGVKIDGMTDRDAELYNSFLNKNTNEGENTPEENQGEENTPEENDGEENKPEENEGEENKPEENEGEENKPEENEGADNDSLENPRPQMNPSQAANITLRKFDRMAQMGEEGKAELDATIGRYEALPEVRFGGENKESEIYTLAVYAKKFRENKEDPDLAKLDDVLSQYGIKVTKDEKGSAVELGTTASNEKYDPAKVKNSVLSLETEKQTSQENSDKYNISTQQKEKSEYSKMLSEQRKNRYNGD